MYIKPEFLTLWKFNLNLVYIPLLVPIQPVGNYYQSPDKNTWDLLQSHGTQQSPEVLPSSATRKMMVMYLQFFFWKDDDDVPKISPTGLPGRY